MHNLLIAGVVLLNSLVFGQGLLAQVSDDMDSGWWPVPPPWGEDGGNGGS